MTWRLDLKNHRHCVRCGFLLPQKKLRQELSKGIDFYYCKSCKPELFKEEEA